MGSGRRTIWRRDHLYVDAAVNQTGDVTITGQDLSGRLWGEYEYALTVLRDDVATLVAALGGSAGDDVLDLLAANAETLVTAGEKSWLEAHSIPAEFWSRIEPL